MNICDEVFDLDCSATIYPYIGTKDINQSFHMEADIDRDVDVERLKAAVQKMCDRTPTMFVCLQEHALGYKLRRLHDTQSLVKPYPAVMHEPFAIRDGEPMIRIFYRGNRIAVEVFHVVSDGSGVIALLKSILAEYYRSMGEEIPCTDGVLSPLDPPKATEVEDSFRANFEKGHKSVSRSGKRAFQYHPDGPFAPWHLTELTMPVSALKAVAKAHGATLTEFICTLYLMSFHASESGKKTKKPITLSVPVNLRGLFGSESLRNFSLYFVASAAEAEQNPTFERILENVKKQFKEGTDKERLHDMICTNVAQSSMPAFTYAPRALKRAILKTGAKLYGECMFTSVVSNLGVVRMPAALQKHVKMFRAVLGRTPVNHIKTTAYCYGDVFGIMFSSMLRSREIEETMKRLFTSYNIPVTLRAHM